MSKNIPMEIDALVNSLCDKDTSKYMGSDDIVNGNPAFRWDLEVEGKHYVIWFTNRGES